MTFTSYGFILSLGLLIPIYYIVPRKCRWVLLLGYSYFFYAFCDIYLSLYLLAVTLTVYLSALVISYSHDKEREYLSSRGEDFSKEARKNYKRIVKHRRRIVMALCLIIDLGLLAVVKYAGFGLSVINPFIAAAGGQALSVPDILLPMGISYYMFQSLSYLIDVTRGTVKAEKNPFKFALFVSFFPQLVQGPISRYDKLSRTLFSGGPFEAANLIHGAERVLWGYFKKLVVADRVLPAVTLISSDVNTYDGGYAFFGLLYYTIALYADFTGGIDIAIGVAQMLGIEVAENFNLPYFSQSLKDYWRRWHISMGSWFRDYLYYPLATSKPIHGLSKWAGAHIGKGIGRRIPVYLAGLLTWAATGLWHGAGITFVVWGILNWAILMISEEFTNPVIRFHNRFNLDGKKWYKVFRMARTLLIVSLLRSLDIYDTVGDAFHACLSIFSGKNWAVVFTGGLIDIGLSLADHIVLAAGTLLMLLVGVFRYRHGSFREELDEWTYPASFTAMLLLFVIVIVFGAYGQGYDASQFIYTGF